jgi:hypothetical protein
LHTPCIGCCQFPLKKNDLYVFSFANLSSPEGADALPPSLLLQGQTFQAVDIRKIAKSRMIYDEFPVLHTFKR